MIFENLRVGRIVVHEVFPRNEDRTIRPPAFSDRLEVLSAEALGAFRLRVTDALAGQTQSLEMRIAKHGAGSLLDVAEALVGCTDAVFLEGSRTVANKLAEAQLGRRIPGGMLIVFDGTVGSSSTHFLGVIKAETQAGFRRATSGAQAVIEFLENVFLTPATRLYKIGILAFDNIAMARPDGRRAFVFDSNISLSNREAAAAYFYDGFLGCALPSDGPYQTMKFFDLTKEFIKGSPLEPSQRRDAMDSLFVFIKDEQDPTFTSEQFSERFIPAALRDSYTEFMAAKKFTSSAVMRDTSEMGSRLRRRRFKFGQDVELSASPDALKSQVVIEAVQPAEQVAGGATTWTRITIRQPLTAEQ